MDKEVNKRFHTMDRYFLDIHGNKVVKHLLDFGDKYVQNIINHSNNFWKDVLHSWLKVLRTIDYSLSTTNVCAMPIWYNTNICVGNKTIYVKLWYEHGVKIVSDFLNNDGTFLSQHDFEKQFSLTNIFTMQFNSVISAISKFFKTMSVNRSDLSKDFSPFIPFYFGYILLNEKCSKVLCQLINSKDIVPKAIQKWNTELSLYLEMILWKIFLKFVLRQLLILQYNGYNTEFFTEFFQQTTLYYLKKINVISYDVCAFCKENVETIQHVFMTCSEILPIWNNLSMYIYRKTSNRVGFNVKNVLFGELSFCGYNKVVNFIILYSKQYIFNCSKQDKKPDIVGMLHHLSFKYKVEKYIAIKSCEITKFNKLWLNWKNIFEI